MTRSLTVSVEHFPTAGRFSISRGSRTEIVVVTATIRQGEVIGRGECVPYARYGETVEAVAQAIRGMADRIASGMDRTGLQDALPAGAARNALDCALWDFDAKLSGVPAHVAAGIDRVAPATTAYTISFAEPSAMADATRAAAHRPILKIKLGGSDDLERVRLVRAAAPESTLLADANEGWNDENVERHLAACAEAGFVVVEQPLPAGRDAILASIHHPVAICADESLHVRHDLGQLAGRYDAVNIKLDKAGGLTEALLLAADARAHGFGVMVGCMLGTSLAMAPAMLLTHLASFVDLDGPLLLARDREPALSYRDSVVEAPRPELWG